MRISTIAVILPLISALVVTAAPTAALPDNAAIPENFAPGVPGYDDLAERHFGWGFGWVKRLTAAKVAKSVGSVLGPSTSKSNGLPHLTEVKRSEDCIEKWQSMLMGKRLGEISDEVTFEEKDLPANHRIISPDTISTQDYDPNRLNVYVNDEGFVKEVRYG